MYVLLYGTHSALKLEKCGKNKNFHDDVRHKGSDILICDPNQHYSINGTGRPALPSLPLSIF